MRKFLVDHCDKNGRICYEISTWTSLTGTWKIVSMYMNMASNIFEEAIHSFLCRMSPFLVYDHKITYETPGQEK